MSLNIPIFYGSVRSNRQGIKAVKFLENKIKERGWAPIIIDPIEYKLPLLDKMYKEYESGQAPEVLEKLANIIRKADGFIIVSAEYNHTMPPALTNLMDYFLDIYAWRPSAIVSYSAGGFGGVRVATHLRDYLAELGISSIPSSFPISKIQDVFDIDGKALDEAYDRRINKFLDELEWYAKALKTQRAKGLPR